MLEREVVQLSVNTAHNQCHLIEYIKYIEFQKDRADGISQAWVDADIRRLNISTCLLSNITRCQATRFSSSILLYELSGA